MAYVILNWFHFDDMAIVQNKKARPHLFNTANKARAYAVENLNANFVVVNVGS